MCRNLKGNLLWYHLVKWQNFFFKALCTYISRKADHHKNHCNTDLCFFVYHPSLAVSGHWNCSHSYLISTLMLGKQVSAIPSSLSHLFAIVIFISLLCPATLPNFDIWWGQMIRIWEIYVFTLQNSWAFQIDSIKRRTVCLTINVF